MTMKSVVAALAIVAAAFTGSALAQVPSIALDSGPDISNGQSDLLGLGNSNAVYWVDKVIQDASIPQGPGAGQQETKIGVSPNVGPNGEVAFRTQWHWPVPDPNPGQSIKAYPSILQGAKPGFANSGCDCPGGKYIRYTDGRNTLNTPDPRPWGPTPGTFFPLQLPLTAPINSSFSWSNNVAPSGKGHLAYDILLQNTPVQQTGWNSAGEISYEVMVELNGWDYAPNSGWFSHTVSIDGRIYSVYDYSPAAPGPWRFIVFVAQDAPINNATLDLAKFVTHATTYTDASSDWRPSGNQYVVSAELGVEIGEGAGDLTVWNYRVWKGSSSGSDTTPPPPNRIQAENGQFSGSGMSLHTDIAGYEGTGFLGWFSNAGDQMSVSFPNIAAGKYDINIRYTSFTNTQQNNVVVNGASTSQTFPATGDGTWLIKTISGVTLAPGTNVIGITKDWGWIGVDYIEIVPSGSPVRIQAENGQFSGSGISVHTDVAGYEGTGFLGWFSDAGDQMSVSFPNVTAGTYNINIRYNSFTATQQNNVVVNGASTSQTFPATGDGTWLVKTITGVPLTQGTNVIGITKDWGWMGVDYIEITK